jgi:hypothetical protein
MIYRRVIDVTKTSPLNDQNGNWSRLSSSGFFLEGKKNDISLEENEITTSVPSHLLYYEGIDDSPDVFKRVRLFTRWQDAEESRSGELFMKFGEVSLWHVAGPAAEVCTQKSNLLRETWENRNKFGIDEYESLEEREKLRVNVWHLFMDFFFLGTCRRKARPVFIVYSKHKQFRHEVAETLRELDWLDPNKSGVVATTWCNPVIRQAIIEVNVRYHGWDRRFAEEVY